MKQYYITLLILASSWTSFSQTCKIKIYYDNNGNRVQRIQDCTGPRPSPPVDSTLAQKVQLDSASGAQHQMLGRIQVYPNPAETKVIVRIDADLLQSGCSIQIMDAIGRILDQRKNVSTPTSIFDLEKYTDGTYYVLIRTATTSNTINIVKQTGNGYK